MIEKIVLRNLLGFERDGNNESDKFEINFCKGTNIFIGENGTGKTTLLKFLYAFCFYKSENFNYNFVDSGFASKIEKMFTFSTNSLYSFNRYDLYIEIEDEKNIYYFKRPLTDEENIIGKDYIMPALFIPTSEMLSRSRGFVEHYEKYNLPFDDTQIDIIKNARLNETRELTPLAKKLLPAVSKVIDGEVLYENDTFYVVKNNGMKLEFSLEAEGLRKFGLLWKLLRNGLFDEPGTVLFWDEPEANLNPKLIPALVDILLELQKNGVQMFLATHEYNLARYFDLNREMKEDVMFHNLYKKEDGYIYCDSSHIYQDLEGKAFEEADKALYKMVVNKTLEEM